MVLIENRHACETEIETNEMRTIKRQSDRKGDKALGNIDRIKERTTAWQNERQEKKKQSDASGEIIILSPFFTRIFNQNHKSVGHDRHTYCSKR